MVESGTFSISVRGNVATSVASGAWDEGIAEHYRKEYIRTIAPLIDQPWFSVVDLTNWQVKTDDVWWSIEKLNLWLADNNLVSEAFVVTDKAQLAIVERSQRPFHEVDTCFFDSLKSAQNYVANCSTKLPMIATG